MSPELAVVLTLAFLMAVTAAFVVSASVITERSGPVIGALVATLPISAGPAHTVFSPHPPAAVISQKAPAGLPINPRTILLVPTYLVLWQRRSASVTYLGA